MSLCVKEKNNSISEFINYINLIRRDRINEKSYLAKALKVSWPTANAIIKKLVDNEIAIEYDGSIIINRNYGMYLGISIGGTECKVALIDFSFSPVDFDEQTPVSRKVLELKKKMSALKFSKQSNPTYVFACFSTPNRPKEISDLCNAIISTALNFFDNSNLCLLGIGISFPGIFNHDSGSDSIYKMSFCPNLSKLTGISLIDLFDKELLSIMQKNNISFAINHDTDAATVFEKEQLYRFDNPDRAFCNNRNVACLYLGMGLGMGLIMKNQLLTGSSNSTGEIGHIFAPSLNGLRQYGLSKKEIDELELLSEKSSQCHCGIKNCLESQIRSIVFQANSHEDFIQNTQDINSFFSDHPNSYLVFKYYISYIMNLLISILNIDLLILCGKGFIGSSDLKFEVDQIKMNSAINTSATTCKVLFGSGRADCVAAGAAILSSYKTKDRNAIEWLPIDLKTD